jgi:hypothetical protein
MAKTKCGFDSGPSGSGRDLLVALGPTLLVDIGFDPNFRPAPGSLLVPTPVPGITGINALVDTGAVESCIDSLLAAQLSLPIINRRHISGVHGKREVNVHLAQVRVPTLGHIVYGEFCAVDLAAGGQHHRALLGRTFLQTFTMTYEGRSGTVTLSSD